MSEPFLVVEHLRKSFDDKEVVKGISFSIGKGEVFGLLGPNGAGKTTTISMLSLLIPRTSGSISLGGTDIQADPVATKQRIGLVPQELSLYMQLSAYDNLIFFGRMYGLRGSQLLKRVDALLELVSLRDRARDPIEIFSGGMKRRINLAAGLVHSPQILFLDEPTVGVDPQSRNAIFEGVEQLCREGLTIIYTTHYMEEAERLCNRVAIIDEGQLVAMDAPSELVRTLGGGLLEARFAKVEPQIIQEKLNASPHLREVRFIQDSFSLEVTDPQKGLAAVVEIARDLDAPITAMRIHEPNLESVFLHHTGKQLRD